MVTQTEDRADDKPKTARRRGPARGAAKPAAANATNSAKNNATTSKSDGAKSRGKSGNGGSTTGALLGVAAAGVAVGVAAMIGRKAVVQAPTALAGDWDVALAAEHAATLKVFDALQETTAKNTTKRTMLLANLKHMLSKHAFQEENVIYPALRDAGQTEAADHLNSDHGYVKQYLYELTNCPKDSERFLTILAKFRADLEEHVREEESALFPKLKDELSVEQNAKLTKEMNKEGFKLA